MGFIRRPSYFKSFQCIASACTDSCCQHWEIDIDDDTLQFYQSVSGPFGERLKNNIAVPQDEDDDPAHFIQCEEERCPFLNDRNLCDIILTLGEEHISQICTHHPRYYDWFLGCSEAGVGLCCEEAARLILRPENDDQFDILPDETDCSADEVQQDPDLQFESEVEQMLFPMREKLFDLVRGKGSPDQKMQSLWISADEMQNILDDKMFPDPEAEPSEPLETDWNARFWEPEFLSDLIDFYLELEINDEQWYTLLQNVKQNLTVIPEKRTSFLSFFAGRMYEYDNLLCYFLFRYFMKAREDTALREKVAFALISVCMIQLLDIYTWLQTGTLSLWQQIEICKLYSKEIEYDEDNMEQVSMYEL